MFSCLVVSLFPHTYSHFSHTHSITYLFFPTFQLSPLFSHKCSVPSSFFSNTFGCLRHSKKYSSPFFNHTFSSLPFFLSPRVAFGIQKKYIYILFNTFHFSLSFFLSHFLLSPSFFPHFPFPPLFSHTFHCLPFFPHFHFPFNFHSFLFF